MNWAKLIEEDFDTNYTLYLKSKEWKEKQKAALEQNPICSYCDRQRKTTRVSHKIYANLGNETRQDLKISCGYCQSGGKPDEREVKCRFENRKLIDQLTTLFGLDDHWICYEEDGLHLVWQNLVKHNILQLSVIIGVEGNIRVWYDRIHTAVEYTDLTQQKAMNRIRKLIEA